MAVARHSENIEVLDGDQDDTIYANETTITARRTNVEMSEGGHYESLDLQKKNDAVYEDLRAKTRKDKRLPKKIRQSGRRPFRVAVCLGILCFISTGVNIAQVVHYRSPSRPNCMTNDNLTLENLMQERNQLQSEVNQLKTQITDGSPCSNSMTNDTLQGHDNTLKSINLTQNTRLKSDNKNLTQIYRESCPSGWKKFGRSCYNITTGGKTWQEGREECQNQGADLVVINSGEEQEFINGLRSGGYYSWIGLTRTEGRWTWVDGTPLTTQYWVSGYPVDVEDWDCAEYYHGTDPGELYNGLCSSTWASICEK